MDNRPHIDLNNNEYVVIQAPAGRHLLTFSYSTGLISFADSFQCGVEIDIRDGKIMHLGFLDLVDPSGAVLESTSYSGNQSELTSVTLPETGTYTIWVTSTSYGWDSYSLEIVCHQD